MPQQQHGTALTEGQLAEFVGAGTKALILIAAKLGVELAYNWANNGEAMERAFLSVLMPPEESAYSVISYLHNYFYWYNLDRR